MNDASSEARNSDGGGDLVRRADAAERIPAREALEQVGLHVPGARPRRAVRIVPGRDRSWSGCRGARSASATEPHEVDRGPAFAAL